MTFATLPTAIQRTLAKRELRRRGVAVDADRVGVALRDLCATLITLLPGDGSKHADRRAALAARVADGTTTTDDLAVLLALPADALAVVGMSPNEFVAWLQSIDDFV